MIFFLTSSSWPVKVSSRLARCLLSMSVQHDHHGYAGEYVGGGQLLTRHVGNSGASQSGDCRSCDDLGSGLNYRDAVPFEYQHTKPSTVWRLWRSKAVTQQKRHGRNVTRCEQWRFIVDQLYGWCGWPEHHQDFRFSFVFAWVELTSTPRQFRISPDLCQWTESG